MVEEVPLSIFINGRHFVTAMISPQMRKEFVTGHLFAERIISGPQEIESLEIEGNVARVIVAHPMRAIVPRRPIVSGCGGIASFLDESKLPEIKSDLRIGRMQAQEAMGAISLSETHIATGGVHSVGLFCENGADLHHRGHRPAQCPGQGHRLCASPEARFRFSAGPLWPAQAGYPRTWPSSALWPAFPSSSRVEPLPAWPSPLPRGRVCASSVFCEERGFPFTPAGRDLQLTEGCLFEDYSITNSKRFFLRVLA